MAIENELPPHFTADAAHALEAARLTIQAMQRQVAECEDHNSELQAVIVRVRAACEAGDRAARNRIAQASPDALRWEGTRAAYAEVWELVKPVV